MKLYLTESVNGFLKNLAKLHTTALGEKRISKNLSLPEECDPVCFCRNIIKCPDSEIKREGKNWYVTGGNCRITVNAGSCTIITAHILKTLK